LLEGVEKSIAERPDGVAEGDKNKAGTHGDTGGKHATLLQLSQQSRIEGSLSQTITGVSLLNLISIGDDIFSKQQTI
jgi:hypothetical protein